MFKMWSELHGRKTLQNGTLGTMQKILVVDDSRIMRRIIAGYLIRMNLTNVVEASNGRQALDILAAEDIDLVISDWSMQGVTGLDVLRAVRSKRSTQDLPFIMVTAEAQLYHILEAFRAQVSQYIVKPFSFRQFEYVIGSFLTVGFTG